MVKGEGRAYVLLFLNFYQLDIVTQAFPAAFTRVFLHLREKA